MPRHYHHGRLTSEQKKLIEDNLPYLWYYYKKKVHPKYKHLGEESMDDLKAEMLLRFCHAAEKYDASKGAKFATFATFYLRNAVKLFFSERAKHSSLNNVESVPFIEDVNVATKHGKHVVWEDLAKLFDLAELSNEEKDILTQIYRDHHPQKVLAAKYKMTRESIRNRIEVGIAKLQGYALSHDLEFEDFREVWVVSARRALRVKNGYVQRDTVCL